MRSTGFCHDPLAQNESPHSTWHRRAILIFVASAVASCSPKSTSTSPAPAATKNHALAASRNDVVRFLDQATFGPTAQDIQHLDQDLGRDLNAWLDEQIAAPISNYPEVCCDGSRADTICNQVIACGPEDFYALTQRAPSDCNPGSTCRRDNYTMWKLQQIFYRNALTAPDQLRQRIVFGLNQILVTAGRGPLNYANRMTTYLRMLEGNAFGNFRQILYDVSRDAAMGRYLDNITNSATQPNENYAREVMQLFSIGLVVLNPDGTTDNTPTYGQDTVVELTRALTGWVLAPALASNTETGQNVPNYRDPLRANAARHDTGAKVLFAGSPFEARIPAGQTAAQDLNSAIDILFNHPNVGPFIGKTLIQMLVTSNPSPQYVTRVTQAFNDNGSGERGDMRAVVRAILLDPEARNETPAPAFGKLREPVLAVTSLLRNLGYTVPFPAMDVDPVSDLALTSPAGTPSTYLDQGEDVFRSPTVFNFFQPDFTIPAMPQYLGPEFGILSTSTMLARYNLLYRLVTGTIPSQSLYRRNFVRLDTSDFTPLAGDANALVEALNQRLLRGQLTSDLRNIIVSSISGATGDQRVQEALFLVAGSTIYQVQR